MSTFVTVNIAYFRLIDISKAILENCFLLIAMFDFYLLCFILTVHFVISLESCSILQGTEIDRNQC